MPVSRKRSCVQCRAAKARCSLTAPCTRCCDRGLACTFEPHTLDSLPRNDSSHSLRAPRPLAPAPEGLGNRPNFLDTSKPAGFPSETQRVGPGGLGSSNSSGSVFDTDFTPCADDINCRDSFVPQAEDVQASTLGAIVQDIAADDNTGLSWLTPGMDEAMMNHSHLVALSELSPQFQISDSVSESGLVTYKEKLLSPRQRSTPEGFFSNTVLLGQVMAYPQMMAKGNRLPPFIFPRCMMGGPVAFDCETHGAHHCLPEILAVCSNMVQLFERRTQSSKAFVWKTIYAENARLVREYESYSREHKFEAVQATIIYILLLAQDPDSVESNSAISLLETIAKLGPAVYPGFEITVEPTHYGLDRKGWLLQESARRTVCIIYGIQLLLDFQIISPGSHGGCSGFEKCPLPCARDLWEPVSNGEWTKRYREYYPSGASNEMVLQIGTIRTAVGAGEDNVAVFAELSRWCSRLDDLGMLVWTTVVSESKGHL